MNRFVAILFVLVSFEQILHTTSYSRQKRCIVIQKQSGTHGDSAEGEDERIEEPNERPENPHNQRHGSSLHDAEEFPPKFLKYKHGQSRKLGEFYRLKNKMRPYRRT